MDASALLSHAERLASASPAAWVWLTVWEGNKRAIAFYRHFGYSDVGSATYAFEGKTYENRVLARQLSALA